ncbi:outer membrane usher protein [Scandinavium goeteborgense]|uniref:outer membrane usher protein n=1 Tax=Scandinavium goeteborgense TaxID=1851514 RepID=UPI000F6682B2|nr:outer membrane usher protein [Scandinavium goeteborgense]QKN79771.1 outer membrane usher protein [Scandinavium goeteborgense]
MKNNNQKSRPLPFRERIASATLSIVLSGVSICSHAEEIQFNTDVLDVKDRSNIDIGRFSKSGYIMPGAYDFSVSVNTQTLPEEYTVNFIDDPDSKNSSYACLTAEIVDQLGLKDSAKEKLIWKDKGQCLDINSLPGLTAKGDLGSSTLIINIPQAYMEYTAPDWDPPSRWDHGINGFLFDYNVNATSNWQHSDYNQDKDYSLSGNGTTGVNLGNWRFRADWQANLDHATGSGDNSQKKVDISRAYAYRPIPSIGAKLTVGDDYFDSDVFDSFRFVGASLDTDDNMLPPNLRGYAPEITGVARTNAKVTVSQQGRVLYDTQVAAGPFKIQDISDSVSGSLDVRVEEQDGSVQTYQVNTASVPYLTRPGSIRYKLAVGKPREYDYGSSDTENQDGTDNYNDSYDYSDYGPSFGSGEISWGISNGWSLYGGAIGGKDYNSLSLGVGRDMLALGAVALDFTGSRALVPQSDKSLTGGSVRVSYSKNFDEYDSQVTFAGYRFSQKDFMTMSEYLDAIHGDDTQENSKQKYTITFNKQFRKSGMSIYANFSHETYWNSPVNNYYNVSLSRTFDAFGFHNISLSLTAFKNKYNNTNDNGAYLGLTLPIGDNDSVSFNSSLSNNELSNSASYYNTIDDHNSYQLSAGESSDGPTASGYYTYLGDAAEVDSNMSYQANQFTSVGVSIKGGFTATSKGAALHRTNSMGEARLMVDVGDTANVPVQGYGATVRTNSMGVAVISDVNSYYRSKANIDINNLDNNVDVTNSVVQATLTEGAIGYRKFAVITGEKAMATIRLADGSAPPFGALITNKDKQQTGIVGDDGTVYLSGINANEEMNIEWDGKKQCSIILPSALPKDLTLSGINLLLPCK